MIDFIKKGPESFWTALGNVGLDCTVPILTITLWHIVISASLFAIVALIVSITRRHKKLENQLHVKEVTAPYAALDDPLTLRLHPHRMADALGESGYRGLSKSDAAKKLNDKYEKRYFVIEIRESNKKLLAKEIRLEAWAFKLEEDQFRLDPITQKELKAGSESKYDDDTKDDTGVDGKFDIYFRPVRWWDFRHWLNHPSREIRYTIYVAIFAAFLEYSGFIFKLVGAIFRMFP